MKNKIQLTFMAAVMVLASVGCKKDDAQPYSSANPDPGANEVWIQDFAFSPSSITVSVNTTITWTNKDAVAHTATSNNGVFDSGSISDGGTYSYHFTTPGTYAYLCTPHPHMTGTIIVQ